jgi:hypothetical protein
VADITNLRGTGATRTGLSAQDPSYWETAVGYSAPREVLDCPASQHSQRLTVPYPLSWANRT